MRFSKKTLWLKKIILLHSSYLSDTENKMTLRKQELQEKLENRIPRFNGDYTLAAVW